MEVLNDLVGYKNKKIYQESEYFCFSIDSVILASLVNINARDKKIVDFCSGNIPIPLILSTRTNAKIYGIEIQNEIYKLGKKNIEINKLSDQIELIKDDVKNAFLHFNDETVDVVTCNPPYFKYSEKSYINTNDIKAIARHEILINLDDIVKSSKSILKSKGRLAFIHSSTRIMDVVTILEKYNFGVKRIIPIYSKKDSALAKIVFIEATKNTNHSVKIEKPIYIYETNGKYSDFVEKILKG